ncbi:MAG: 2-amino-4-hydroxy-6-hydroxymethyldihydropteridine diphosphokinase [Candidatus Zixiibacteriota bacterium]|nr:MAG: 2-amino-4-hydroxy-6-hydroxymethyldihydropteridine diphosphokinase [candidate division Zixibacteria bacterium]
MSEIVYILMGSNMGDREKNLQRALTRLELISGLEVVATSGIYVSEAIDMEGENPSFMNQAVMVMYQYTPSALLSELEAVERDMGRTGKGQKLPRAIDLDILLFGDQIIETEALSIPHRELLNRPFAMLPLLQITPDLIHPVTSTPIADFVSEQDEQEVILYKDHVGRDIRT